MTHLKTDLRTERYTFFPFLLAESIALIPPTGDGLVLGHRHRFGDWIYRPERGWRRCAQIKFALPRRSRPTGYVIAERRRDALASCRPSNPQERNLVILRKAEFIARRSNCGVLEERATSSSSRG